MHLNLVTKKGSDSQKVIVQCVIEKPPNRRRLTTEQEKKADHCNQVETGGKDRQVEILSSVSDHGWLATQTSSFTWIL